MQTKSSKGFFFVVRVAGSIFFEKHKRRLSITDAAE